MPTWKEVFAKGREFSGGVVFAGADDEDVLKAAVTLLKEFKGSVFLTSTTSVIDKVNRVADDLRVEVDLSRVEEVILDNEEDMLNEAVKLASRKGVLAKGMVHTAKFLKAVFTKQNGLRRDGDVFSHLGVFKWNDPESGYERIIGLSDAAINPKPNLELKIKIIDNAAKAFVSMGFENPKIALLAAVETVNPAMPETLDAAYLSKMSDRGQIKWQVEGPLALDNAVNRGAAEKKKIRGKVKGDADILIASEIAAANMLYKSFTFVAGLEMAGIVVGGRNPFVLTSRADSWEHKVKSVLLACAVV